MKRIDSKLLKPIRSRKDYRKALALVEKYFDARKGTPEGDFVEVLSLLLENYENRHHPVPPPTPIEALRFRMDQLGLSAQDLAEVLGSRSRASEVLAKRRPLSLSMIRTLHKKMGVPAESLIGP